MKENTQKNKRFRWLLALVVGLAVLASCSTEPPAEKYMLAAGVSMITDDSAMVANVMCLSEAMMPITDESATVTVNGTKIPPFLFNYYKSDLDAVAVGEGVTLHFAYDGADFTSTRTMPAKPVITTVAGAEFDPGADITINWNAVAPVPDSIDVIIALDTVSGEAYEFSCDGTATSHTIPAGTLLADDFIDVIVVSVNSYATSSDRFSMAAYTVCNQNDVLIDTNLP